MPLETTDGFEWGVTPTSSPDSVLEKVKQDAQKMAAGWTLWQAALESAIIANPAQQAAGVYIPPPALLLDPAAKFEGIPSSSNSVIDKSTNILKAARKNEAWIYGAFTDITWSRQAAYDALFAEEVDEEYFDCGNFPSDTHELYLCRSLAIAKLITEPRRSAAQVDQYMRFSQVLAWIEQNKSNIDEHATEFGISPDLLAGILASEMMWDYDLVDVWQDDAISFLEDMSYGNLPGLDVVQDLLKEKGGSLMDPLISHMETPLINPNLIPGGPGIANVEESAFNVAKMDLRSSPDLRNIDWNKLAYDKGYVVTETGSIQAAALVTRWTVEQAGFDHTTELTSQEMAFIWAGFRAGTDDERLTPPDKRVWGYSNEYIGYSQWLGRESLPFPANAQLALPFMKYFHTTPLFSR